MRLKPSQKSPLTFMITADNGDVVGSVNVSSQREAEELSRKFNGERGILDASTVKGKSAVEALAASLKPVKVSKQFVLRGCV
jgi:hypothetical protein